MAFKDDFYALLSVTGVTNLVEGRIYPVIAPQGTTEDFIVWRRVGGDPLAVLSGASISRQYVNVQIDCLAEKYDRASDIADAVRAAIKAGSAAFKGNARVPVDLYEQEARLHRVVVEATLFHRA